MRVDRFSQRSWVVWLRLLVASILILLLDSIGRVKLLRRSFEWSLSPVSYGVGRMQSWSRSLDRQTRFVKSGAVRLVDLERQVAELSTTVKRVNELEKENRSLREQLGVLDKQYMYYVGEVVSISDNVLIATVEGGGAEVGAPVLWQDGLIGVVEGVGGWMVRIRLVEGFGYEIPVNIVDGSGRDVGEALLGNDIVNGLVVNQILQGVEMNVGDVIITRGSDGKIPEGLVIGTLSKLVGADADVYQQAVVDPIFKPEYGDLVYIVGGVK